MATPLAGSLGLFICLRALTGLGEASYYPAGTALISDYHDSSTRSRALSFHQTAVLVGGIFGGSLAGWLAERYHWTYAFYIYGIAGVLLAVVLWIFMKEPPKGMAEHALEIRRAPLGSLLKTPSCILLSIVFFGANFVTWALTTWMPTYLHDHYGMSLTRAAIIGTSSIQLSSLAGILLSGVVADYFEKYTLLSRFYILSAGLILASPFVFICGFTLSIKVLIPAMVGAGFMKGLFDSNIYAAMHDVMPPSMRSTAVGMMTFVGFAGGGLAPYVIGVYAPRLGLGVAMGLTSILYLLGGGILLIFRGTIRRDVENLARKLAGGIQEPETI